MRINNRTPFSSAVLRTIAQRVIENELDPEQRQGVTVHFTVRGSRTTAARRARHAGFRRRTIGPLPPRLKYNQAIVRIALQRSLDTPKLAAMFTAHDLAHEFAEMRGMNHKQMRTPRYFYRKGWEQFVEWAKEFPLTLDPK